MRILLRHSKLDVNLRSVARDAPIHVAAHKGHAAVVKLLAGHASSDAAVVAEANEKLHQKGVAVGAGVGAVAW